MRVTDEERRAMRDYQWSLHGGRDPATTKVVKFPGNVRPIDYPRDTARIIVLPGITGRNEAIARVIGAALAERRESGG